MKTRLSIAICMLSVVSALLLSCSVTPVPVSAPFFSPNSGTFDSDQLITISCLSPRASIRYTMDGSTPTQTTGVLYTLPFSVTPNQTVKAVAYETGWSDSAVATAAYTIPVPSWTARVFVALAKGPSTAAATSP